MIHRNPSNPPKTETAISAVKLDQVGKATNALRDILKDEPTSVQSEVLARMQVDNDLHKAIRDMANPFDESNRGDAWQENRERLADIRHRLETLPFCKERRELEREAKTLIHRWRRDLKQQRSEHNKRVARLDKARDVLKSARAWLNAPKTLQRAEQSLFHQMRRAPFDDDLVTTKFEDGPIPPYSCEKFWTDCEVFVVEHDWAAAFDKATGINNDVVRLPHDVCAFEFRISGRHVIATVRIDEGAGGMVILAVAKMPDGWILLSPKCVRANGDISRKKAGDDALFHDWSGAHFSARGEGDDLYWLIHQQIRYVCIALSAQVATKEIIRLPWRSNRPPPAAIRQPTFSYHVVSLARRTRYERLPLDPDEAPVSRRRLHFRRGHHRHYETHKVWIEWMLVGDPDLGFVDKHYKL